MTTAIKCRCCGRMFYPAPKNTLYCSQECKAEAHRISNRKWKRKMWAEKKMELLKQINAMGKE